MNKNLLLSVAGIILGFTIGFFIANAMTKSAPFVVPTTDAANVNEPNAAPPLDPTQTNGQLPPNHPPVNPTDNATNGMSAATNNSVAANSPDAQVAMDAADRAPNNFDAQMIAGRTFYVAKDYKRASLYLERALKIKPNDIDALTGLGDTKYDAGDFVGAAGYYEKSLAINPNNPDVRTDYGSTFFQRTPPDYDRAISEYRKSLAIDPKHEKSWENIIAAAQRKGDTATARDAAQKLLAVNPNNLSAKTVLEK